MLKLPIESKTAIEQLFTSAVDIIKITDIEFLIRSNRKLPGIKNSLKIEDVVTFITEKRLYRRLVFKFPSKTEIRYARPSQFTYEVILTLRPNSYFTHLNALFLHGLSDNSDNRIYLNWEQKSKSVLSSKLTQDGIINAFSRPQRIPKQGKASIDGYDVFILNGKQTEQFGVM